MSKDEPLRCARTLDRLRPCPAPPAVMIVFTDAGIRPRAWCAEHFAGVREAFARSMKRNAWREVPLSPGGARGPGR